MRLENKQAELVAAPSTPLSPCRGCAGTEAPFLGRLWMPRCICGLFLAKCWHTGLGSLEKNNFASFTGTKANYQLTNFIDFKSLLAEVLL